MNLLDLVVLLAATVAGWIGFRMGFLRRALSWAGLAVGILVAIAWVDDVTDGLRSEQPRTRLLAALAFVIFVCVGAQALGAALGGALRRALDGRTGPGFRRIDAIAGAFVGVAGVLVLVWLLIPALASSPGWTAEATRRSAIIRAIDDLAPPAPSDAQALGRLVGDQSFPEVFDSLVAPDAGVPPGEGVPADVDARVRRSVVKVEGTACDHVLEGTGFVAAKDLVVTNAHVVAGEERSDVLTEDGRRLDTDLVAFDGDRDLAVLRVPGLALPPLERGTAELDDRGALFGHPRGGPLRQSPARIAERIVARGTDITRSHPTDRDVYVLAAVTAPGDSGGPIVMSDGRVVGVMFAFDLVEETTAYALTRTELDTVLDPVIAGTSRAPRSSGPCLE